MTPPPFFRGISGGRTNGKQGKCIDTCNFRAAEMLVGVPPNPLDFWPPWPEETLSASPSLTGLLLIALVVRQPAQVIHAALDRHQLPHILLGLAVFQIKSFFPRCQLAAFFF